MDLCYPSPVALLHKENHMKRIAVFGGSFNPPGIHHLKITEVLSRKFDRVKIIPCGPRPDKETTNDIAPIHRAVMADLTFGAAASNVDVELFDLENGTFTRTHALQARYESEGEIWHVVGTDLIRGGGKAESFIHREWMHGPELWDRLNFAVVVWSGTKFNPADLPPHHEIIHPRKSGSSETIRMKAYARRSLKGLVVPEVADYIERIGLYRGNGERRDYAVTLAEPRLHIIADERNPQARKIQKQFKDFESEHPNLIVVIGGDGMMLRAIREHWRRRIPFLGINAGHLGFLLNEAGPRVSGKFFLQEFLSRPSPLLYIETTDREHKKAETLAFNDAWVQAELGKAGWFEVMVNGTSRIARMVGDGVLVSTAAGSTASARAMGANPVPVGTDILVVVGSNVAQPLNWRNGANLPIDSTVEFVNKDESGWRKIYGFADGVNLGEVSRMKVRISRIAAAELLFTKDNDLRKKLALTQFPL